MGDMPSDFWPSKNRNRGYGSILGPPNLKKLGGKVSNHLKNNLVVIDRMFGQDS